jgi:methyl-accepting chemotaxis protein
MARLRYAHKFAVIGAVVLACLGFVGFSYLGEVSKQVDFSQKERVGVVYVGPAADLVIALVQARSAAVAQASGHGSADFATARQAVDGAIAAVDRADRQVGQQLQVSKEWAGLRPRVLQATGQQQQPASATLATYNQLLTDALTLVTNAGNNSNLILDPDLDSFYVMDEWITKLPPLLETIGRTSGLEATFVASAKPVSVDDRIQLALDQGSITTNLGGVDGDLSTSFANTADHALKPTLDSRRTALDAAVKAFDQHLGGAVKGNLDVAAAARLETAAVDAGAALERASGPQLDHLLTARIDRLNAAAHRVELIALAAILLLAYLFAGFYASVASAVRKILEGLRGLDAHDLTDLSSGLQAIAAGDLTVDAQPSIQPIENAGRDELGDMTRTFNRMLVKTSESLGAYGAMREQLVTMLGRISNTSNSVSTGSAQIASSSDETGRASGEVAGAVGEIAHGAGRQVEIIAEAKHSAEQVADAIAASAERASATAEVARSAREVARGGDEAAVEATEAMHSVRDSSAAVTATITELAAKSEQIGTIVGTITGIAEQTNLLALNAAIEAARAGEQGRGFAVVAEEVRKLAEESQRAAEEIAQLISTIQAETTNAVRVVEDGAARTRDGAAVVEQTREAFLEIGASVEDITQRIEGIAAASHEIVEGAHSMRQRIDEVAAVAEHSSSSTEAVSASTEQTAASAEQIAATAQELSGSAEELGRLVAQFKLTS